MKEISLRNIYQQYIDCLNLQDWASLGTFVDDSVVHNGQRFGLSGYKTMLERDFAEIPDLKFAPEFVLESPPFIGCRLMFNCTPKSQFLGLSVNGRHVRFSENVFYHFRDARIVEVWSVIDKQAIEAQLRD